MRSGCNVFWSSQAVWWWIVLRVLEIIPPLMLIVADAGWIALRVLEMIPPLKLIVADVGFSLTITDGSFVEAFIGLDAVRIWGCERSSCVTVETAELASACCNLAVEAGAHGCGGGGMLK
jgi:hypothetical protein